MKALPAALRQILRDLIEKKLWPVAVLLLAAIVVAPMLLGASSPEAADPVPVAAAPSAAPPVPAVPPAAAKTDAASAKHGKGGKVEDPFYDPPAAPQGSSSVTALAPDAGGAGSAPTADKTAPAARGDAAKTSEQPVAKPPAASTREPAARARPAVYYRTVVGWGPDRAASHPIARLTPLGGRDDPAALYLGVTRSDALWAIFALGPNTTSRGDATCKTGTGCRMIGLRRGDKQIVTVRDTDGRTLRRFTLRVRSVRTVTTSPARARTMRARIHSDGRAAIGAMRQDPVGAAVLGQAAYSLRTGLLHATVPRAVKQVTR